MRFGDEFGSWSVDDLPGNSQVAISHNVFIFAAQRGQGHGTRQHEERLATLKKLGYDAVICTVVANNAAELHQLDRAGWKYCETFRSSRADHDVCFYIKTLR